MGREKEEEEEEECRAQPSAPPSGAAQWRKGPRAGHGTAQARGLARARAGQEEAAGAACGPERRRKENGGGLRVAGSLIPRHGNVGTGVSPSPCWLCTERSRYPLGGLGARVLPRWARSGVS